MTSEEDESRENVLRHRREGEEEERPHNQ